MCKKRENKEQRTDVRQVSMQMVKVSPDFNSMKADDAYFHDAKITRDIDIRRAKLIGDPVNTELK